MDTNSTDNAGKTLLVCGMSRSGTTLLTTILDSHNDVSMGYEIMPAGLRSCREVVQCLQASIDAADDTEDTQAIARHLSEIGEKALSVFVKRSARSLVPATQLLDIVKQSYEDGLLDLSVIQARATIGNNIAAQKAATEGSAHSGFKLNAPALSKFSEHLPHNSYFIYVLRNPKDVFASQVSKGFDKSFQDVCDAWLSYLKNYEEMARNKPDNCVLVRYEDLVQSPKTAIMAICSAVGLNFDDAMLSFFDGKASIHQFNHANRESLRQDFFTTSIGRWSTELSLEVQNGIESGCAKHMRNYGYVVHQDSRANLSDQFIRKHLARCQRASKFQITEYGKLLDEILDEEDAVLLLREACNPVSDVSDQKIAVIRHDIDHDLGTAVAIAKWEYDNRIRSTFCVLPSAWYYGELVGGFYRRHHSLLKCLRQIQDYGHEINLHNDLLSSALLGALDPAMVLAKELEFLRDGGIQVEGTSGHGHALCRQLDFNNIELFAGRTWDSNGGDRTLTYEGRSFETGSLSMTDFGLTYEAYDLPRDLYVTDSGGRPRLILNTRGKNGYRRKERPDLVPYAHVKGVLTHPIWWSEGCQENLSEFPSLEELRVAREVLRESRREVFTS